MPSLRPLALWTSALVDVLYPPLCPICGFRVHAVEFPVCPSCLRKPERADPQELRQALREADPHAPLWTNVFALWLFDKGGTIQRLHHELKYGNRPALGRHLGRITGTALLETLQVRQLPGLVLPVPLAKARHLERGYNQSSALAQGIADAVGAQCSERMLIRVRTTRSQVGLSREARRSNVRDAFALKEQSDLSSSNVILVDDVLTTGATLAAAAQPLVNRMPLSLHLVTLSAARKL